MERAEGLLGKGRKEGEAGQESLAYLFETVLRIRIEIMQILTRIWILPIGHLKTCIHHTIFFFFSLSPKLNLKLKLK